MYMKWAEKQGCKGRIIEKYPPMGGGTKLVTIEFESKYAFGYLFGERGQHRMIRSSLDGSPLHEVLIYCFLHFISKHYSICQYLFCFIIANMSAPFQSRKKRKKKGASLNQWSLLCLFQTSLAVVDVIPLFLERVPELQIDNEDLEISSISQCEKEKDGHIAEHAVSICHIPTGIKVHCSGIIIRALCFLNGFHLTMRFWPYPSPSRKRGSVQTGGGGGN